MPRLLPVMPMNQALCAACALLVAALPLSSGMAQGTTTIGTLGHWNGLDGDLIGGAPSVTTIGQTFVAPSGAGSLQSLAFFLDDLSTLTFQAFVMGWDGSKASGPVLFQSGTLTTTNNHGADGFERFDITIAGGLPVTAGGSYVAFLFATAGLANVGVTGGFGDDAYSGGGFVFQDNGGSFGSVTSTPWDSSLSFRDMAFELVFAPPEAASADTPVALLAVDVAAMASALFSSVPTALAQRELALGASRTTLRDFNGRLFRARAGGGVGEGADEDAEYHTVTVGEGDGIEPGGGGKGTKVVYATARPVEQRWQVFTSFDYGNFDLDADKNFLGLQSDTYAESAGIERAVSRHLLLGGGLSWLESNADHGTDVDGVTLAAYACGAWGGLYADLLYGATLLDHDIDRETGTGATAHAKPDSVTHAVNFNTGWNFRIGAWTTGPFAGVDYAHTDIDGYTETGGGTAATEVSGQSVDSLISRVGWQATCRMERSWGAVVPQVRLGWERENLDSNDDLTVGLVHSPYYLVQGTSIHSTGAPFDITVAGHGRQRDSMTVGAGVLVEMGRRLNVLLDYEGVLLADGYSAHFGRVTLGWRF